MRLSCLSVGGWVDAIFVSGKVASDFLIQLYITCLKLKEVLKKLAFFLNIKSVDVSHRVT